MMIRCRRLRKTRLVEPTKDLFGGKSWHSVVVLAGDRLAFVGCWEALKAVSCWLAELGGGHPSSRPSTFVHKGWSLTGGACTPRKAPHDLRKGASLNRPSANLAALGVPRLPLKLKGDSGGSHSKTVAQSKETIALGAVGMVSAS